MGAVVRLNTRLEPAVTAAKAPAIKTDTMSSTKVKPAPLLVDLMITFVANISSALLGWMLEEFFSHPIAALEGEGRRLGEAGYGE